MGKRFFQNRLQKYEFLQLPFITNSCSVTVIKYKTSFKEVMLQLQWAKYYEPVTNNSAEARKQEVNFYKPAKQVGPNVQKFCGINLLLVFHSNGRRKRTSQLGNIVLARGAHEKVKINVHHCLPFTPGISSIANYTHAQNIINTLQWMLIRLSSCWCKWGARGAGRVWPHVRAFMQCSWQPFQLCTFLIYRNSETVSTLQTKKEKPTTEPCHGANSSVYCTVLPARCLLQHTFSVSPLVVRATAEMELGQLSLGSGQGKKNFFLK